MQIHNGDLTTCMGYYNQDELQNTIGTLMSDTICDNEINAEIPKAINTAKSTSTGKSIFEFDKNSPVANAYNNLAKEVLENERTRQKDGTSKVR